MWKIKQRTRCKQKGDLESAREEYLRACTYYRAPLFIMNPKDAASHENRRKMQFCFQKAAALFDPPIEIIHVPFQGKLLPGYFWEVVNAFKTLRNTGT